MSDFQTSQRCPLHGQWSIDDDASLDCPRCYRLLEMELDEQVAAARAAAEEDDE